MRDPPLTLVFLGSEDPPPLHFCIFFTNTLFGVIIDLGFVCIGRAFVKTAHRIVCRKIDFRQSQLPPDVLAKWGRWVYEGGEQSRAAATSENSHRLFPGSEARFPCPGAPLAACIGL